MSSDRNRQAETPKNPNVTQEHLATELVSKYGMKEGMTKNVPMSTSVQLVQTTEDNMLNKEAYRYIQPVCYIYGYVYVGSLLYLSVCTRPDISQAMGVLAGHMARPSMEHWTAAKGVLRYIAGSLQTGILFVKGNTTVKTMILPAIQRPGGPPLGLCSHWQVEPSHGAANYNPWWQCLHQKLSTWLQRKVSRRHCG